MRSALTRCIDPALLKWCAPLLAIFAGLVLVLPDAGATPVTPEPVRVAQADTPGDEPAAAREGGDEDALPAIQYSDEPLPESVVRTRNALLHAARTGDLETLRPILAAIAPNLIYSFGGDEDPIAFWTQVSLDGTGRDILADMIKVFSSGFVRMHEDTADEMFIWPYHFVYPIEELTPEQEVELYLLLPAQYRKDMEAAGGYIGFRAAIRPTGELVFFVAGD